MAAALARRRVRFWHRIERYAERRLVTAYDLLIVSEARRENSRP